MTTETAKRHKILQDLKQEVNRGFITTETEVHGKKFTLKTLNEEEDSWSDQFVQTATVYAMMVSQRTPKLAVSITHINGIPVSDLFEYPDDWSAEVKSDYDRNPIRKRYWVRSEMMKFLADLDRDTIMKLWAAYEDLDKRRAEVIKQLPNS